MNLHEAKIALATQWGFREHGLIMRRLSKGAVETIEIAKMDAICLCRGNVVQFFPIDWKKQHSLQLNMLLTTPRQPEMAA
jgi:hypothetical protein